MKRQLMIMKDFLRDRKKIIVFLSVVFGLTSILLSKLDTDFNYRWLSLFLFLLSVLLSLSFGIFATVRLISEKKLFVKNNLFILAIILMVAFISRFALLKNYPFVSLGDEVRDGGLNVQEIIRGDIKNIFYYGRYLAHGLIIPTLIIPSYYIFGSSPLAFRFPAALISCMDIFIIYILAGAAFNKKVAFWSALTIAASQIHLFYSRTEVVVMWSSLLTSLVLLFIFVVLEEKDRYLFVSLGALLGFVFNFHAAVRAIGCIALFIFVIILFVDLFKKKLIKKGIVINLLLMIFFIFVGFGPRLFFTSPKIFFHTSRFVFGENAYHSDKGLIKIFENYVQSLKVWVFSPTTSWFPVHQPVYSGVLAILFFIGIIKNIFFSKDIFSKIIILFSLLIPFTNSAITEMVNADHRIIPLIPVGALIVGVGVSSLLGMIINNKLKIIVSGAIIIIFLSNIFNFYFQRMGDKTDKSFDYLSMHLIYFLKSDQNPFGKEICIFTSKNNLKELELLHYQEQYRFYLTEFKIAKKSSESLKDNEIIVSSNCNSFSKGKRVIYCSSLGWDCPRTGGESSIVF